MNIKRHCQFLLDKEKDKPDARLRYRIKWGSNITAFIVGYRIDIEKWSLETQRCKTSTTHGKKKVQASIINKEINRYESLVNDTFNHFEISNIVPTTQAFKEAFNQRIGKTEKQEPKKFFEYFDEFTKTVGVQNAWTTATFTKFKSIRKHLYDFNSNLVLNDLTEDQLHEFITYQHNIKLRNTTIAKNVSFLRWFLRWCANKDYYKGHLHDLFRPKLKGTDGNSKEVIHLTWDELQSLIRFNFPDSKQYLDRVRDVFVFTCFTALRYSDVAKLKRSDIRGNALHIVTQKTSDGLKIELNKYSSAILDKYKDSVFLNDKALPVISNVKMNEYLKEMGELAGINTPQRVVYFKGNERHEEVYPKYSLLTTHCGRRTFIVNAFYLGIGAETIMKWTGHSDYQAMKPYIKIVDDLKEKEMNKFNLFER